MIEENIQLLSIFNEQNSVEDNIQLHSILFSEQFAARLNVV